MVTPQFEINTEEPGHIMLIGRDPGTQEMRQGRPFCGPAGELLNNCLDEAGLRRDQLNIINLVAVQPPNNLFHLHKQSDIDAGLYYLDDMLTDLSPSCVVAMGNEACWATIPDWPSSKGAAGGIRTSSGIEDRRGYFWEGKLGHKVISTVHPAAALRSWVPWRMLLALDFQRAREHELIPLEELRPTREVEVVPW